jgi:putative endonuclease
MGKNNTDKGKWAEEVASHYLENKMFKVLFRNWRTLRGDIDIVALDGDCLVFVEVKAGFSQSYGPPEFRITSSKKRQLYKLASIFIAEEDFSNIEHQSYRFDVVIVDGHQNKYDIRHYKNAFYL